MKRPTHRAGISLTEVFVNSERDSRSIDWRLDTAVETDSNPRSQRKLFHYIAAGGLRQLRRTTADDLAQLRRRRFLFFFTVCGIIWLVFFLLPCR